MSHGVFREEQLSYLRHPDKKIKIPVQINFTQTSSLASRFMKDLGQKIPLWQTPKEDGNYTGVIKESIDNEGTAWHFQVED